MSLLNCLRFKLGEVLISIASRIIAGRLSDISYNATFNLDENLSVGIAKGNVGKIEHCIATSMYEMAIYAKENKFDDTTASAMLYKI